jgi:deazaflavin-dependent oxidoreductase (nitroreductase family)
MQLQSRTMDHRIRRALERPHRIDITTIGRLTGQPRRIELGFLNLDGRVYLSGMPGFARSWIANLRAEPRFTFHLKGPVQADLPATARVILDPVERRRVMERVAQAWRRTDVDAMVATSPLVEVSFEG